MISESWFAIDSDDSPLRNREITTVMLGIDNEILVVVHIAFEWRRDVHRA